MSPRSFMRAAAVIAALAVCAPARAGGTGDEALSVTGGGRIALALDGSGYLHDIESGRLSLGLRWPGAEGAEFLGSGGLLLRFRAGDGEDPVTLGPGSFEPLLEGRGVAGAAAGCRGGRRYPAEGCDDDGDGTADEDPLDGRDNDGDGRVDEDFAAIGDGMYVTCSSAREYPLVVTRTIHVWNYGHVRDFMGFTTTVEYLPPEGYDEPLRDFELLHYIDFEIGSEDDTDRGRDDTGFFLQPLPAGNGDSGTEEPPVAAVSGGREGPMAAVVFFGVSGPAGPEEAAAREAASPRRMDSLWAGWEKPRVTLGGDAGALDPEKAELIRGLHGRDMLAEPSVTGDVVIAHRFYPAVDLEPGGRIVLEGAVVFGHDYASLSRNISRARETWEGLALPSGGALRWVVPARKAVRVEAEATIAPIWVQGEKRPAVSIDLPQIEGEEIEWLRVAGELADDYDTAGGRIVLALSDETASGPFAIEGQLTDGTMFTSWIGEDELRRYSGGSGLEPGRLPDDSIRLFPNPFVTDLTIDITVHEPSTFAESPDAAVQPGISSVRVYDVKGRLVRTVIADEVLHPGEHTLGWDGTDESGTEVAAGVYYCRLQIGERSLTRRVILLR